MKNVCALVLCGVLVSLNSAGLEFKHYFISRDLPVSDRGAGDYGLTALADLDRDGDLDFVLGGRGTRPAKLYWLEFVSKDK